VGRGKRPPNTRNAATGTCVDDSSYGLRDFVCQNQDGPYPGFQQFSIS